MWKVFARRTDGRTTTTDDGRCAMTIAHSSLRLRWAKNVFCYKAVVSTHLQSRKSQKQRHLMEHVSKIGWQSWRGKNLNEAKIKKYAHWYFVCKFHPRFFIDHSLHLLNEIRKKTFCENYVRSSVRIVEYTKYQRRCETASWSDIKVDLRTWLHVPSGTLWSTSSDTHQVVEI